MILQPILELTVLFPSAFVCFLAAKDYLRIKIRTLVLIALSVLTLVCVLGGTLCWYMEWPTNYLLPVVLIPAAVIYVRVLTLPAWKSVSIFLGVCGVMSCTSGLIVAVDAMLSSGDMYLWQSPAASLLDLGCGCLLVALIWYPTTHAVRDLLRDENLVRTWYVFWVLPATFILINLFMFPRQDGILYVGRMLEIYIVFSLLMTGLLLLFYFLFYLVARELNANIQLRQENQFLHMQSTQYEALRSTIAETRQARHDLRHHFNVLSALAERGAWDELRRYLDEAKGSVPAAELVWCENRAADGVAGHYAALSNREAISFICEMTLPQVLPVSDMDVCVVLSNLLENALDASRKAMQNRYIRLHAALRGDNLVLLTVENAYSGEISEHEGIFQSTKRRGDGIGLQSVVHIAEKNGGYCKFLYGNGIFTANVMLRGEA